MILKIIFLESGRKRAKASESKVARKGGESGRKRAKGGICISSFFFFEVLHMKNPCGLDLCSEHFQPWLPTARRSICASSRQIIAPFHRTSIGDSRAWRVSSTDPTRVNSNASAKAGAKRERRGRSGSSCNFLLLT